MRNSRYFHLKRTRSLIQNRITFWSRERCSLPGPGHSQPEAWPPRAGPAAGEDSLSVEGLGAFHSLFSVGYKRHGQPPVPHLLQARGTVVGQFWRVELTAHIASTPAWLPSALVSSCDRPEPGLRATAFSLSRSFSFRVMAYSTTVVAPGPGGAGPQADCCSPATAMERTIVTYA